MMSLEVLDLLKAISIGAFSGLVCSFLIISTMLRYIKKLEERPREDILLEMLQNCMQHNEEIKEKVENLIQQIRMQTSQNTNGDK